MITYSEKEIFKPFELLKAKMAQKICDCIADIPSLRCHELARIVGKLLNLDVQDGYYGFCEHSWLWTSEKFAGLPATEIPHGCLPNVLDVYSVGRFPAVSLVASSTNAASIFLYRPGLERNDIDVEFVEGLVRSLRSMQEVWIKVGA